jgi:hypothetical protein
MSEIQDRIAVREFVVVDDSDQPRAVISCAPDGGPPYLQLLDAAGLPRLILSLDPHGTPHVSLFSETNTLLGSFGLDLDGAGISLWSENGCFNRFIAVSDDEGFKEGFTTLAPK